MWNDVLANLPMSPSVLDQYASIHNSIGQDETAFGSIAKEPGKQDEEMGAKESGVPQDEEMRVKESSVQQEKEMGVKESGVPQDEEMCAKESRVQQDQEMGAGAL